MKIAVTGTSGQLGISLHQYLFARGFDVIPLDRSRLNFRDFDNLKRYLEQVRPDFVINCAAFTKIDLAEINVQEAYTINATIPTELAKYCRQKKIKFIHISTDSVFSSLTPIFNHISDKPNPLNVYAKSKLAGEIGILQEYPHGAIIIRTAWLFGSSGSKFVQAIISKGIKNRPFKVVEDQFGQPTHTISLSKFIGYLIDTGVRNGVFHFCSKDFTSRFNLAKEILILAGLDQELVIPIPTIRVIGVAVRPKYSLLDVSSQSLNNYTNVPEWKNELIDFFRDYNLPNE